MKRILLLTVASLLLLAPTCTAQQAIKLSWDACDANNNCYVTDPVLAQGMVYKLYDKPVSGTVTLLGSLSATTCVSVVAPALITCTGTAPLLSLGRHLLSLTVSDNTGAESAQSNTVSWGLGPVISLRIGIK